MHGIRHDLRLSFEPAEKIRRGFRLWRSFIDEWNVAGFRAPWLISTPTLEQVLPEFFRYDSSVPTTSCLTPYSRSRGCSTAVPFFKNQLLILPISLPGDGELSTFGYTPQQRAELWWRETCNIQAMGGCPVFLGHWTQNYLANPTHYELHLNFLKHVTKEMPADRTPRNWFRGMREDLSLCTL